MLKHPTLDIHRLIVHPNHFRRGIAQHLLEFVLKLELNAKSYIVQTGALNLPAIGLYQKLGFTAVFIFVDAILALTCMKTAS